MRFARWKTMIFAAALAGSLLAGATLLSGARPAQENVKVNHTSLKPGDMAPDFTLLDNQWKQIHLSDYRGKKNVVLAFYVLAFTEG
jgi:cytochrome oxidase Cu insertion factor (SCO1/SenC/PrrC family)